MEFDIDIEGHGKKHSNSHDRFFFVLSIFLAALSVMAAYSSISASRLNVESNHNMSEAITHLVNSSDWWNDYQAHKLREKVWEVQIDNLNNSMNNPSLTQADKDSIEHLIAKYQSYQNKLYDKTAKESLINTSTKATLEEKEYRDAMSIANYNSSRAEQYEFATTFLVISTGLGVVADLTKKRLLAYPCFAIGGVGLFFLFLVTLGFISII